MINLMLKRAKRFHASVSGCAEFDCHDALQGLRKMRQSGHSVSFTSFLVKVTGVLLEKYPYLNQHIFTSLTGKQKIAQFDEVSCSLVIQREIENQQKILLPLKIVDPNLKSISAIEQEIVFYKKAELTKLPQFIKLQQISKLPCWVLDYLSYKMRSDPKFYKQYYGSYGLSSMSSYRTSFFSMQALANTAITFIPFGMTNKRVGPKQKRKHLLINAVCDHYVLDGHQIAESSQALKKMIEKPDLLMDG